MHLTGNSADYICFEKVAKIFDAKNSIKLIPDSIIFVDSPLIDHSYENNLSPYDKYKKNLKRQSGSISPNLKLRTNHGKSVNLH